MLKLTAEEIKKIKSELVDELTDLIYLKNQKDYKDIETIKNSIKKCRIKLNKYSTSQLVIQYIISIYKDFPNSRYFRTRHVTNFIRDLNLSYSKNESNYAYIIIKRLTQKGYLEKHDTIWKIQDSILELEHKDEN